MADIASRFLLANLAAATAVLLVLLLRKPARRLFGARLAYVLWLLVPLAGFASLVPRVVEIVMPAQSIEETLFLQSPPVFDPAPAPVVLDAAEAMPVPPPASISAWALGGLIWLAGAIAMATWFAYGQSRFLSDARKGKAGPAVVGVFRPSIVVPADFEQRFDPKEREVILAHETIHLSRNDAHINALVALTRCVCWFNPMIHIAAHLMRVDQELACDATVAEHHPKAKAVYASALLKAQLAVRPLPLGCYWPAGTEHPLTERIAMLKQERPGRMRRVLGSALLVGLASGAGFAAWAAMPAEERFIEAPVPQQTRLGIADSPLPAGPQTDSTATHPNQSQPAADEPGPTPQLIVRQLEQSMESPTRKAREADFDSSDPVHLLGRVEKVEFSDTTYIAFVRASSIAACPDGPAQANTALWELAPTPYWGDRDAVIRDLLNQDVYARGFNAKVKSCSPNCRMLARGVFKVRANQQSFPYLAAFTDRALNCLSPPATRAAPEPALYQPQTPPTGASPDDQQTPSLAAPTSSWPIRITSDASEHIQKEGQGIYVGNVRMTQGDSRLTADKLTAICRLSTLGECEQIRELIAEGQVGYTTSEVNIRGDRAVYDYASGAITFTGDVSSIRGNGVIRGARIVYSVGERRITVYPDRGSAPAIQSTVPAGAKPEPTLYKPQTPPSGASPDDRQTPSPAAKVIPVQLTSTLSRQPVLRLNGKTSPVLNGSSVVTSGFGDRVDPYNDRTAFHEGIDLAAPFDAPVHTPAQAVVTFAGVRSDGRGRLVELDLGNSTKILLGHLNEIRVKEGDKVKPGAVVGTVGSTGRSAGAHLHLEYIWQDKSFDPATVKNLVF
jgi:lipopolysaccharide transport protein LptA